MVTPIVVDSGRCPDTIAELLSTAGEVPVGGSLDQATDRATDRGRAAPRGSAGGSLAPGFEIGGATDPSTDPATDWVGNVAGSSAAARITALATTLLGTRIPLAVGRTARTATPAQRRALAARDKGCIIPGCGIPAEACQTHHVTDWAAGGDTDLPNLALFRLSHELLAQTLNRWPVGRCGPASQAVRRGLRGAV